jgi:hypothetical protein
MKAGGRCSICRVQLVTEGTGTDDPSVFGQEAHIVARGQGGPRAGDVADVDAYDNLILLCSKHHKQVDDQVGYYSVDRLKEIKRMHEEWVTSLDDPWPLPWVACCLRKILVRNSYVLRENVSTKKCARSWRAGSFVLKARALYEFAG